MLSIRFVKFTEFEQIAPVSIAMQLAVTFNVENFIGAMIRKVAMAMVMDINDPREYVWIKKQPKIQLDKSTIQKENLFLIEHIAHETTISKTMNAAVLLMLPAPNPNQSSLLSVADESILPADNGSMI